MISAIFYAVFGHAPYNIQRGKAFVWVSPQKFAEFATAWSLCGLSNNRTKGFFYYGSTGANDSRDKFLLRVWGFPIQPETLQDCKRFLGGLIADDSTTEQSSDEQKRIYGERNALYVRIHRVIE